VPYLYSTAKKNRVIHLSAVVTYSTYVQYAAAMLVVHLTSEYYDDDHRSCQLVFIHALLTMTTVRQLFGVLYKNTQFAKVFRN
jgi:hypothetical protein